MVFFFTIFSFQIFSWLAPFASTQIFFPKKTSEDWIADHSNYEQFPLLNAAKRGDFETVRKLAGIETNLLEKDFFSRTALHVASREGHMQIVNFLIEEKKMDPEEEDFFGNTSLLLAVEGNKLAAVKYLFLKGGDLNKKNKSGETALRIATRKGHKELVQFIAAYTIGPEGSASFLLSIKCKEFAIAKALLERGVSLDIKDKDEKTALHLAAYYGWVEGVSLLLGKGADVNVKDKEQNTPLHLALISGEKECSQIVGNLLKAGAKVNAIDKYGYTPLQLAFYRNCAISQKAVEYLLEKDVDVWARRKPCSNGCASCVDSGKCDCQVVESLLFLSLCHMRNHKIAELFAKKANGNVEIPLAFFVLKNVGRDPSLLGMLFMRKDYMSFFAGVGGGFLWAIAGGMKFHSYKKTKKENDEKRKEKDKDKDKEKKVFLTKAQGALLILGTCLFGVSWGLSGDS